MERPLLAAIETLTLADLTPVVGCASCENTTLERAHLFLSPEIREYDDPSASTLPQTLSRPGHQSEGRPQSGRSYFHLCHLASRSDGTTRDAPIPHRSLMRSAEQTHQGRCLRALGIWMDTAGGNRARPGTLLG